MGALGRLHLEPHCRRSPSAAPRRGFDARRVHQSHAARDPRRLPGQLPRARACAAAATGARSRPSRGERRGGAADARAARRRSARRAAAGGVHQRDRRSAGGPAADAIEVVHSITQTPQTWLDNKVYELEGGLGIDWDAPWRCSRRACWMRCSRRIPGCSHELAAIGRGVGSNGPLAGPCRGARPHRARQRHRGSAAERSAARAGIRRRRRPSRSDRRDRRRLHPELRRTHASRPRACPPVAGPARSRRPAGRHRDGKGLGADRRRAGDPRNRPHVPADQRRPAGAADPGDPSPGGRADALTNADVIPVTGGPPPRLPRTATPDGSGLRHLHLGQHRRAEGRHDSAPRRAQHSRGSDGALRVYQRGSRALGIVARVRSVDLRPVRHPGRGRRGGGSFGERQAESARLG